jgi:hypothetical protein
VKELIKKIEDKGVKCCHFTVSKEAIEHSYEIGLIPKDAQMMEAKAQNVL